MENQRHRPAGCRNLRACVVFLILLAASSWAVEPIEQLGGIESVIDVRSCFSPPTENFESWLEWESDRNHHFDESSFREQYSKDEFEEFSHRLDCIFFRYKVDGLTIGGFLVAPKTQRGLPVIVFNRGGTGEFGRMDFGGLYLNAFWLADAGYTVIGSQYRGGLGLPPEVGGRDEWGGADVEDVVALVPIAEELDVADTDRLGMYAGSRGSVNMFLASRRISSVKTMVSKSGVYDLSHELEFRPRMGRTYREHIPNFATDRDNALAERSVSQQVEELSLNVPILLLHGAYDERASASGALDFARRLQSRWHPYRLVIYENDDHYLSEHQDQMRKTILDWLERYLR